MTGVLFIVGVFVFPCLVGGAIGARHRSADLEQWEFEELVRRHPEALHWLSQFGKILSLEPPPPLPPPPPLQKEDKQC